MAKSKSNLPPEFLAKLANGGRKGGQATGASKARGGPEFYRALVRKRWKKSKPKR